MLDIFAGRLRVAIRSVALLAAIALTAFGATAAQPPEIEARVAERAVRNGFADVVIEVQNDAHMPFARPTPISSFVGRERAQRVVLELHRAGAKDVYNSGIGLILARLSTAALNRVARIEEVRSVKLRLGREGSMAGAIDAVGIQHASIPVEGFESGALGEEIVIIDGGFDLTHPALTGATINQYCSCGSASAGCCPNGSNWQELGQSAQAPTVPANAISALYHGTAVAATVVSQGGAWALGAAPRVTINVISVQGNQWLTSSINPNYAPFYSDVGIHQALDKVKQWKQSGRKIRAVSMSFRTIASANSGPSCEEKPKFCTGHMVSTLNPPQNCNVDPDPEAPIYQSKVDALRAEGILVFAAAGNGATLIRSDEEGPINHPLPVPACTDGVIAVSATRHPLNGQPALPLSQPLGEGCAPSWMYPAIPQSRHIWCESTADPLKGIAVPGLMTIPTTRIVPGQAGVIERISAWTTGTSFASPIAAACTAQIANGLEASGIAWNANSVESQLNLATFLAGRLDVNSQSEIWRPYLNCYETLARLKSQVASIKFRQESQSGTFFDPSTPGQGLLIDVSPTFNYFFAALYTYGQNPVADGGGLRWYSIQPKPNQGFTKDSDVARVLVQRTNFTDPRFGQPLCTSGPCNPPLITEAEADLKFTSCRDIELELLPNPGSDFTIFNNRKLTLRRIGAPGTCQENSLIIDKGSSVTSSKCAPMGFNSGLTGTWQRANTSGPTWIEDTAHNGRGWLIEVNSGSPGNNDCFMFVGWYDYRGIGDSVGERPRWLTLQGLAPSQSNPKLFNGAVYATYGGALGLPMPNPSTSLLGPGSVEYLDCNRAILTYTLPPNGPISGYQGIQGTSAAIPLVRVLPKTCSL